MSGLADVRVSFSTAMMTLVTPVSDSGAVEHRPPQPAASVEPARWLMERVDLWHGDWVTGMVGSGFEAYARLFHPPRDRASSPRWADVARANRRTMHPSAEWEQISSPGSYRPEDMGRSGGEPGSPEIGRLDTLALGELCDVLARHTSADRCYFAVWEGCGGLHGPSATAIAFRVGAGAHPPAPRAAPAEWQLDLSGRKFPMPSRNEYYLFEGVIRDAVRIGYWSNETSFHAVSPHFFWPSDHAWCVATEVDYDSTFIGGTQLLIDELCGSPQIEVLKIAPDAPAQDLVNT
jgi:hypothetical protein